jgi:hypothetical protein
MIEAVVCGRSPVILVQHLVCDLRKHNFLSLTHKEAGFFKSEVRNTEERVDCLKLGERLGEQAGADEHKIRRW